MKRCDMQEGDVFYYGTDDIGAYFSVGEPTNDTKEKYPDVRASGVNQTSPGWEDPVVLVSRRPETKRRFARIVLRGKGTPGRSEATGMLATVYDVGTLYLFDSEEAARIGEGEGVLGAHERDVFVVEILEKHEIREQTAMVRTKIPGGDL